jgi:hypothetical protein
MPMNTINTVWGFDFTAPERRALLVTLLSGHRLVDGEPKVPSKLRDIALRVTYQLDAPVVYLDSEDWLLVHNCWSAHDDEAWYQLRDFIRGIHDPSGECAPEAVEVVAEMMTVSERLLEKAKDEGLL